MTPITVLLILFKTGGSFKVLTRKTVLLMMMNCFHGMADQWKCLRYNFQKSYSQEKTELSYCHFSAFCDNIFCEFHPLTSKVVILTQNIEKPFTCYFNIDTHKMIFSSKRIYYEQHIEIQQSRGDPEKAALETSSIS